MGSEMCIRDSSDTMIAAEAGTRGLAVAALFACYVEDRDRERAAIAGFDARGHMKNFVDVPGCAHRVDGIVGAMRTTLAMPDVCQVIMAHSHPGSSAAPSPQDVATTRRLASLVRLAGGWLSDHLIFGDDGIYSMTAQRRVFQWAK